MYDNKRLTKDILDIGYTLPQDPDCVQRVGVCDYAPPGDQSIRRLKTKSTSIRRRQSNRATGICTQSSRYISGLFSWVQSMACDGLHLRKTLICGDGYSAPTRTTAG